MKEFPLLSMFNIHENLLESLLELQNYADVQAVLAKYDGERHSATCEQLSNCTNKADHISYTAGPNPYRRKCNYYLQVKIASVKMYYVKQVLHHLQAFGQVIVYKIIFLTFCLH